MFAGWELADSIVTNPHKWFFAPVDVSLLLTRHMPVLRDSFSLMPEYLRTLDRDEARRRDYNEYTPTLGRKLRALKVWMLVRYFGLEGLRRRIEYHLELGRRMTGWIDANPDFERLAPVPFSTICFRYRPSELAGRESEPAVAARLDKMNVKLMDAVNRSGEAFLSHTKLHGVMTLRVAIANLRMTDGDLEAVWAAILREAAALGARD